MSVPIPPWWLRLLPGGNANNYALAGIAFLAGYFVGKGDGNHWRNLARSGDRHWGHEHGWHDEGEHEYKHTNRERERDHHRRGEEHGR